MRSEAAMEAEILERGDVELVYRPRVGRDEVRGLSDVQRVHLFLMPFNRPLSRLVVLPRKRLPQVRLPRQRFWAFVEQVGPAEELRNLLRGYGYSTKTMGERWQPRAHAAAKGVYALARHGEHTHFVYALSAPRTLGPLEREMNLRPLASYIAAVMNPLRWRAWGPPPSQSIFPERLQSRFGARRYAPVDPPDFLDYPDAELVLIGSSENIWRELGVWLEPERAAQP